MGDLIFFSSSSGNTARFVARLGLPAMRIPASAKAAISAAETPEMPAPMIPAPVMPVPARPYVLICPTFADGEGRGAVPKPVIRFLNDPSRRALLRGVIAAGNRSFGTTFALSGQVISAKCNVPVLYRFELAGTDLDIARVKSGLDEFWGTECLTMA